MTEQGGLERQKESDGPKYKVIRVGTSNLSAQKAPPAVIVTIDIVISMRILDNNSLEGQGKHLPGPAATAVASLWLCLARSGWAVFALDIANFGDDVVGTMISRPCSCLPDRHMRMRFTCWPSKTNWVDPSLGAWRQPPSVTDLPGLCQMLSKASVDDV